MSQITGMSLIDWQRAHYLELLRERYDRCGDARVTILAYCFGSEAYLTREFWRIAFAFLQTFKTNGRMAAVLVCNDVTAEMRDFCAKYGIEIQIEARLVPGRINSMSLDCISRLYQRFRTDYVLIIQNDGFPMRRGLDEFVGTCDYIGAPFVRFITYQDWYPYKYNVGNGGFSLRSKALCTEVARIYNKYLARLPFWPSVFGDDMFYCRFLRVFWPGYNKRFSFPSAEVAGLFSIEHNESFLPQEVCPLGFHSESGFRRVAKYLGALKNGI